MAVAACGWPCAQRPTFARSYPAPAPYSAFSWAGPYFGANVGYQWGSVANSGADPHGFLGGLQLGYNWQSGQFVYRRRDRRAADRRRRHLRRRQILQSVVRHDARPRSASPSTTCCSTAPAASPMAAAEPRLGGVIGNALAFRLDGWRRRRSRPHAELVGQGRISVRQPG